MLQRFQEKLEVFFLGPREWKPLREVPSLWKVEALLWSQYLFRFLPLDIMLQASRLPRPFADFRFGETPWFTGREILQWAGLQPQDVFVDLGSGRGKMVFLAHLGFGARSRGVEMLPGYVRIARRIARWLKLRGVTFQQRDFSQVDVRDATFIYVAGSIFSDETRQSLLTLVDQLPEGAQWLTLSWPCSHPDLQLVDCRSFLFSWGRETIYRYHIKRICIPSSEGFGPMNTILSKKVAVIGLGYVGLPLAVAFGKSVDTLGFDISARRVALLKDGIDSNGEIDVAGANSTHLRFSDQADDLRGRDIYIVTVPTPVDRANHPELSFLEEASKLVGARMAKGAVVVFESTVYPGCTEEVCLPVLEQVSGMKGGEDFFLGYSPERINPGDLEHTLETIYKVVAGQNQETTDLLAELYGLLNDNKIFRAANIKTAEAAKVIENTQRDLNIALMNELSMIFRRLGINTREVLAASRTKWNFLPFEPGLVGGHCIPVDPYYLTHKAVMVGYHPEVILAGRRINDQMGSYVAHEVVRLMAQSGMNPREGPVLMLGATFKENVRDLRNSLALKLIEELQGYSVSVVVHDPVAEPDELKRRNVELVEDPWAGERRYQGVILAVAHNQFRQRTPDQLASLLRRPGLLIDLKGLLPSSMALPENVAFWQL